VQSAAGSILVRRQLGKVVILAGMRRRADAAKAPQSGSYSTRARSIMQCHRIHGRRVNQSLAIGTSNVLHAMDHELSSAYAFQ